MSIIISALVITSGALTGAGSSIMLLAIVEGKFPHLKIESIHRKFALAYGAIAGFFIAGNILKSSMPLLEWLVIPIAAIGTPLVLLALALVMGAIFGVFYVLPCFVMAKGSAAFTRFTAATTERFNRSRAWCTSTGIKAHEWAKELGGRYR